MSNLQEVKQQDPLKKICELPKTSKELRCEVITFLRNLGCCIRCILRYSDLNVSDSLVTIFLQPEEKLVGRLLAQWKD